jgi:hypothetical protein
VIDTGVFSVVLTVCAYVVGGCSTCCTVMVTVPTLETAPLTATAWYWNENVP